MNSASENLAHHLGILRERLLPPSDYETAFHYFLEEFGGDAKFIALGEVEEAPNLVAVLGHLATTALGKPVTVKQPRISRVPGVGFLHGSAAVEGRAAVFFYFEAVNTGLLAIIPGVRGAVELARFRLPEALATDPKYN